MATYHRLSEAQLHQLHFEFAQFLATQGIDKNKWDALKQNEPAKIDPLLDAFSDVVWEKLFDEARFLEFITPQKAFLFHAQTHTLKVIVIENEVPTLDLTQEEAWKWVLKHWEDPKLTFSSSIKKYAGERNLVLYDYFKKGAVITEGYLYQQWESILKIQ
ncbi:MAG: DUF6495 family protein [Flavobacteriaceae bacterium]|jgi:hypothetical protein